MCEIGIPSILKIALGSSLNFTLKMTSCLQKTMLREGEGE